MFSIQGSVSRAQGLGLRRLGGRNNRVKGVGLGVEGCRLRGLVLGLRLKGLGLMGFGFRVVETTMWRDQVFFVVRVARLRLRVEVLEGRSFWNRAKRVPTRDLLSLENIWSWVVKNTLFSSKCSLIFEKCPPAGAFFLVGDDSLPSTLLANVETSIRS